MACYTDKSENIYIEYINSCDKTIQIINKSNKLIYDDFHYEMTDVIYGRPYAYKRFYEKAKIVKQKSDSLYQFIDRIENVLTKNSSSNITEIGDEMRMQKEMLDKAKTDKLKLEYTGYRNFLISMIGKDSVLYNILVESINSLLDTTSWNQVPCLSCSKSELVNIMAVLHKLKLEIKIAENSILNYLDGRINAGVNLFWFNKIEVIVEAKAKNIPLKHQYSCNIFIGITDTTISQLAFIEGTEYKTSEGMYAY
ncbi:MAG: hypothetical protein DRJ10_20975, partial [Bacteroidetes bacterium]